MPRQGSMNMCGSEDDLMQCRESNPGFRLNTCAQRLEPKT